MRRYHDRRFQLRVARLLLRDRESTGRPTHDVQPVRKRLRETNEIADDISEQPRRRRDDDRVRHARLDTPQWNPPRVRSRELVRWNELHEHAAIRNHDHRVVARPTRTRAHAPSPPPASLHYPP